MVPLPYRALKLGEEAPRVNIVTHENQRYRKKNRGGGKMTNWWLANFALVAPNTNTGGSVLASGRLFDRRTPPGGPALMRS